MFTKDELLEDYEYLLARYQNEIFYQLDSFMTTHHLTQSDIASKLGVSNSYVNQVLNGKFNFTLKKLIELGLMMGKIPSLEFVSPDEFWKRQNKNKKINSRQRLSVVSKLSS